MHARIEGGPSLTGLWAEIEVRICSPGFEMGSEVVKMYTLYAWMLAAEDGMFMAGPDVFLPAWHARWNVSSILWIYLTNHLVLSPLEAFVKGRQSLGGDWTEFVSASPFSSDDCLVTARKTLIGYLNLMQSPIKSLSIGGR